MIRTQSLVAAFALALNLTSAFTPARAADTTTPGFSQRYLTRS